MPRRKQPTPGRHRDVREELAEVVTEWRPRYRELADKPACSHPLAGRRKRIRTTSIACQTGNCGRTVKTDTFPVASPYDIIAVLSHCSRHGLTVGPFRVNLTSRCTNKL